MRITVVTAAIGTDEVLYDQPDCADTTFVAFCDEQIRISHCWSLQKAYNLFKSARRNSRIHKLLIHQYVDTEYSIWIDSCVELCATPDHLVNTYLKTADIAVFKHRVRNCTYSEAEECSSRDLDSPAIIQSQIDKYRRHSLPVNDGLAECTVVLRRHTPAVERFNNYWWSEYCRFSARDQISFAFAMRQARVQPFFITPTKLENPNFKIHTRPARAEPL